MFDGFPLPMSTAYVTITSEPPGMFRSLGPHDEDSVQVVWIVVQIQGDSPAEHNFVVASGSLLPQDKHRDVLSVLANQNPQSVVGLITRDSEGSATVLAKAQGHQQFPVAAAVAVYKASWGWDESLPIVVRVDEDEFEIYARFDGKAWIAKDSP